MSGFLFKRGSVWWGRVQIASRDHRRSLRTRDRAVAQRRLNAWVEELTAEIRFGEVRYSWDEALLKFVQEVLPSNVAPSTAKRYLVSYRQVHGFLSGMHLDKIGRRELAAIASRPGPSNATKRRDLTAVGAVLRAAVAWGWIDNNPMRSFDRDIIRERRDPIQLPIDQDVQALINICPPMLAGMVVLLRHTGMRLEEAGSLQWRQVDQMRGAINLTKTKWNLPRSVPLSTTAAGTLAGTPRHIASKYVFWHGDGVRYANLSSRFALLRKRAGVSFRIHDLRHLFAVDYLRQRRGSIYDLQQVLGHRSVKTTEIYLSFLTPDEYALATGPAHRPAQL